MIASITREIFKKLANIMEGGISLLVLLILIDTMGDSRENSIAKVLMITLINILLSLKTNMAMINIIISTEMNMGIMISMKLQ